MPEFQIESVPQKDGLHRVKIRVDDSVLTRLERPDDFSQDDWLQVPAEALAFWFVDNWWRIRWEPDPPAGFTPEWRLAHDISSVGGGYCWPRVAFWGEGEQIGVAARADEPGPPPRYLAHGTFLVGAASFEVGVDAFVRLLLRSDTPDSASLKACFKRLSAEREDPAVAAWRKLEAQLGFDQDRAPGELMSALGVLADEYGLDGVQEAALATQRGDAATVLEREIEVARNSAIQMTSPLPAEAIKVNAASGHAPWQLGEDAARQLRGHLGNPTEPLRNRALSDVVGFDVAGKIRLARRNAKYGLRLRDGREDLHRISLSKSWPPSRRFEICRALGDIFWSGGDRLGPLSTANSARQKFQRGFAQGLLCPAESLLAYLPKNRPDADDVKAAARYFHVPVRAVQTILVNKGIVSRNEFQSMVAAS